tara:strand:+ start:65 stop:466 length:402 start_codon:yes stop_codon:yes gene_type:complete
MINKEIFKIASNTENFGSLDNHTHFSNLKNSICGDNIKVYLIVRKEKIINFKYETNSCIYCQASASLLAKNTKYKSVKSVKNFIKNAKFFFNKKNALENNNWKIFKKIMNKRNVARKNCLLLPLKTLLKALNN